ncbi:hypothetical protein B0T11DRAFT_313490 [Plectosphaerella cucumerina]|uniref:Uncharacterized protein n=1 Tax=Plectosphaerella cucumerina TaxID=40658 RepID=A0A8K0TM41_9PEZI|nr:hypothetical protein B0T11DRAFT_313490 [Plectosphaerella cucumerina]
MEPFKVVEMTIRRSLNTVIFRILTTKSVTFKYLITRKMDFAMAESHTSKDFAFDTVPLGDWNAGKLVEVDGRLVLDQTDKIDLESGAVWHPKKIDELDLPQQLDGYDFTSDWQCQGHETGKIIPTPSVLAADCRTAICLYTWNPSITTPNEESIIYQLVAGSGIAPKFLGHITENRDRIIGYVVEKIHGRAATAADYPQCRAALSILHRLGIKYGRITSNSFIVEEDTGRVYLSGFSNASLYGTADDVYMKEQFYLADVLGIDAHRKEQAGLEDAQRKEREARRDAEASKENETPTRPGLGQRRSSRLQRLCRRFTQKEHKNWASVFTSTDKGRI